MSVTSIQISFNHPTLEYLPVSMFGAVMGLTGLSAAWGLAHVRFGVPEWIALAIGVIATISFLAVAVGYGIKLVSAFSAARAEFNHPITGNLFATSFVSALLLPNILAPYALLLARFLWTIGAVGILLFAWFIISRWTSNRQQAVDVTPAWLLPVIGLLDLPLAVPSLDLPEVHGLLMFALAAGVFLTIPIFTLVVARLIFETPLPDGMRPALVILVAPFSVGFSAYIATIGKIDAFAEALYMLALFMIAVVLPQIRHLASCCPFRVSWWAVSFPLAATSTASLRFAIAQPHWLAGGIAVLLLALTTLVIGYLFCRTLAGLVLGELRAMSA